MTTSLPSLPCKLVFHPQTLLFIPHTHTHTHVASKTTALQLTKDRNFQIISRLLGSELNSTDFTQSLSQIAPKSAASQGVNKAQEVKMFSDCQYHNFFKDGVSICVEKNRVTAVHFYPNNRRYQSYKGVWISEQSKQCFDDGACSKTITKGPLPQGLAIHSTNRQVVQILGEPQAKGGGRGSGPIWIDYKQLGIQFDFAHDNWDCSDNPITCLTFYCPNSSKTQ